MSVPPEPTPPPTPATALAQAPTAADRDRAVSVLSRHYAADQLTETEFQARLDQVYLAHTGAELDALLARLPALPVDAEIAPKRIRALLSGQEQRLTGLVPRRLELSARLGYVELDLTRAAFQDGVTEIDVHSFAGYVEIRLPAGVQTESVGHAFLGYFSLKDRPGAAEDAPLVRVSGRATLGYMECHVTERPMLPPGAAARLPPKT
jgi:hypothetical protein